MLPYDAGMESPTAQAPAYVAGPLELHPFRAITLKDSRVGDPASIRAFARPYREVPRRLRRWESQGGLRRDAEPALYLHEYTADGVTIRGLVGALDLNNVTRSLDEAVVYPHEGVRRRQVRDLESRMREMRVNPAPILLLHRGSERLRELVHATTAKAPEQSFTDKTGQLHRVWPIRAPKDLEAYDAELATVHALIADGHHRYAAYLDLARRRPGTSASRGLAMLVDETDTPLHVGAIHRTIVGMRLAQFTEAAERLGMSVTPHSRREAIQAIGHDTFTVTDGTDWVTITPADREGSAAAVGALNTLLREQGVQRRAVHVHHAADEAIASAAEDRVAVLLPACGFDAVLRDVMQGRLLPEKATSFQPKPSLGVMIRSLRDG